MLKEQIKTLINKGDIKGLYMLACDEPGAFFKKISYRQIGKVPMDKLYILLKNHKGQGFSFEELLFQQVQRQVIGEQLNLNNCL